jgi:hypothetical protein
MNPSSLQIFDNFLDTTDFTQLSNFVLSEKFPWFFIENVSIDPQDSALITDPLALETSGFNHVSFDRDWNVESFTYNNLTPLFNKLQSALGFTYQHLIRARLSMKFQKNNFTSNNYNIPHVDYFYPHESLIFYLNDTDGDTRIFDQWHTYSETERPIPPEQFTTQARVTPKANRLVWINGLQYHTASNPVQGTKRVIININLEPL